jgi:hypothetical protein
MGKFLFFQQQRFARRQPFFLGHNRMMLHFVLQGAYNTLITTLLVYVKSRKGFS